MHKSNNEFKELFSFRNTTGSEIVDRFADTTRPQFDHANGMPVVMGSYDGRDLPLLLAALGRSTIPLAPIVVDNKPGRGHIREYAEAMGAEVIDEEIPGQMSAVRTGIEHAAIMHPDNYVIITDDDCLPPAQWAETMARHARLNRKIGGIAYGGVILEHGESRLTDLLRTAYAATTDVRRKFTNSSPKARGPNGILLPDEYGRILEELRTKAPDAFPCDVVVQESVAAAGGKIKSILNPRAFTLTRGDRFNNVSGLAKDLAQRGKNRAKLYED
jgi:hypothetical protein